jgi:hypothetical protein
MMMMMMMMMIIVSVFRCLVLFSYEVPFTNLGAKLGGLPQLFIFLISTWQLTNVKAGYDPLNLNRFEIFIVTTILPFVST